MSYQQYGIPTTGFRFFKDQRYHADDIPNLSGKVAVVTGGTSGLGLESATQLARKGADVVILGSSETRGKQAVHTILRDTGKTVLWRQVDLSDIESAQAAGKGIEVLCPKIDILLLNAGISSSTTASPQGYEPIFALNHLGHFAFVQELMNTFEGSDVRIVVLSSMGHYFVPNGIVYQTLLDPPLKESVAFGDLFQRAAQNYAVSKLANILFARALQRRVGENVYVNAVHPGAVATNIQAAMGSDTQSFGLLAQPINFLLGFLFNYFGLNVHDGALTQLYCCTSPDIVNKNHKGDYFVPVAVQDKTSTDAEDVAVQEKLWEWSVAAIERVSHK